MRMRMGMTRNKRRGRRSEAAADDGIETISKLKCVVIKSVTELPLLMVLQVVSGAPPRRRR